jgi:hypothetical protein
MMTFPTECKIIKFHGSKAPSEFSRNHVLGKMWAAKWHTGTKNSSVASCIAGEKMDYLSFIP